MLLRIIILILVIIIVMMSLPSKENYRDPLYLNRQKFIFDWYPRSNGSIYGFPYFQGGSQNMFTGYPYYDNAY